MSLAGEARQHSHELYELDTVYKLEGNFIYSKLQKNAFLRRRFVVLVECM